MSTVEPEEIALEAEIIAESGEFKPDDPFLGEDIFPESMENEPAEEPAEQPLAAADLGFDVVAATPVKEQTRSKPQFTDFEPREYVPPEEEQKSLKPDAGKKLATTPGVARRKETIARLETWLTTIKKET